MKSILLFLCLAISINPTDTHLSSNANVDLEKASAEIRNEYQDRIEIDMLAKLLYTEARGVKSDTEKAAVVWCVLNRVDDPRWPNTIAGVIRQKHQFAWRIRAPVIAELRELALDVVVRWELERRGWEDIGRVLPKDYVFFSGCRGRNWFRTSYRGRRSWDWSLPSPYAD
jgi:hypothetical protein